jgi:lipid-binding SYLF domain-containing protein
MTITWKHGLSLLSTIIFSLVLASRPANAESPSKLQTRARHALQDLYKQTPGAEALARDAKAILVFPSIVKGGFMIGASYGDGVLFKGDAVAGYYNSTSGSFGFQAGIQKFGYALFFMTESDLRYLNQSRGWELGVGPSITIVDEGIASSITTTTARQGVYAFFFEQRGLMAGIGLQGTKITRIHPD